MHLQHKYGFTVMEIEKSGFQEIHTFDNQSAQGKMDTNLAKTIEGFSDYVKKLNPDLIIVHGDRVETLAGAIVGALNNILVAHIEGGEISGTIDELIRHSVSKLSHIHFVSNSIAANRLRQMGELKKSIFEIGSPDIDVMFSSNLPGLQVVKGYYEIPFESYAIAMFHPITTEFNNMQENANKFVAALLQDTTNYVVIYPNNDLGCETIFKAYKQLSENNRFRIFSSLRFEYFLTLLSNAQFIIGNSSAGIYEAPYYKVPTVNIGNRQKNRLYKGEIIHCPYDTKSICKAIKKAHKHKPNDLQNFFGHGNSSKLFLKVLKTEQFWELRKQKQFQEI